MILGNMYDLEITTVYFKLVETICAYINYLKFICEADKLELGTQSLRGSWNWA